MPLPSASWVQTCLCTMVQPSLPFVSILGSLTLTLVNVILHLSSKALTLPSKILLSWQLIRTCEFFSTAPPCENFKRISREVFSFLCFPYTRNILDFVLFLSPSDSRYWVLRYVLCCTHAGAGHLSPPDDSPHRFVLMRRQRL